MEAVRRVRPINSGSLRSDPKSDAVCHNIAEAFMTVERITRFMVVLVERLILEDALCHGTRTRSYFVGWLPSSTFDSNPIWALDV